MKRWAVFICLELVVFTVFSVARADEFSDNFQDHLNEGALKRLSEDLGSLLGGGSFHSGKTLGFPFGIDVGVHVPIVGIQKENRILSDNGSTAYAVWEQVEIGLPGRLNLLGRIGQVYEANAYGGGVRLGVMKSEDLSKMSLSLGVLYHRLEHDFFKQDTLSLNAVFSLGFPFVHPYLGGGYDRSELDPKPRAFLGQSNSPIQNTTKVDGYRVELGMNISVIPFTYINVGLGLANNHEMIHLGAGVKI